MSDKPDVPQDVNFDGDISQLDSLGIHVFEIFSSLKKGGFDHQDAITLVGHLISSGFMEVATYKFHPSDAEIDLGEDDYLGPEDLDDGDFI